MENTCHCGRTRDMHKKSRWDDTWGERHDFVNQRTVSQYKPMLASPSEPFFNEEWAYERKYDGLRAIFDLREGVNIYSRSGISLNAQFPELTVLDYPYPAVLDGEIYCPDGNGGESLAWLQMRMGQTEPSVVERLQKEYPIRVAFFDVLEWDLIDITDESWHVRRSKLELYMGWLGQLNDQVETSTIMPIKKREDYEFLQNLGVEGLVAKFKDSIYVPGKRRSTWKKFKFEQTLDLQVVGYTELGGTASPYERKFGALKVQDKEGNYRGLVGSGFTEDTHNKCWRLLKDNQLLIIEVEYRMLSKTGLLIEPRFNAIRYDKTEADSLDNR